MTPEPTHGGKREPPPPSDGERIGSYRTVRRIATGTTSDVILGIAEGPLGFSRHVALKMMREGLGADSNARRMFAREATAYAQLSHACIVQLFDFFEHQGRLVMAIEYVDGAPLHRILSLMKSANVELPDAAVLYIGQRLFAALGAAHTAKNRATGEPLALIHRDVNPSNVLVPWTGESKLGDFGLAKLTAGSPETRHLVRGTAGYLSPEQARGEDATARSDVYAAGLVLWELFTRRRAHPVGAVSDADLMLAMQTPRVVPLDVVRTDLDRRVREIVRRAVEPDAQRRTISAEEAAAAISETFDAELGRTRLEQALSRLRPLVVAELAQPTPSSTRTLGESPDTVRNPHGEILPQRPRISSGDERDPLALLLSGDNIELGSAIDDILSEGRPSDNVVSSATAGRRRIDSPPPIAPASIDAIFERTMPIPKSEPTRRGTAPGMPGPSDHGGAPRMGPGATLPGSARTISFEGVPDSQAHDSESPAPHTSPIDPVSAPRPSTTTTKPMVSGFGAPPAPEYLHTPPLPPARLNTPPVGAHALAAMHAHDYGISREPPPMTRGEPSPNGSRTNGAHHLVPTVPPTGRLNKAGRRKRSVLVMLAACAAMGLAGGVAIAGLRYARAKKSSTSTIQPAPAPARAAAETTAFPVAIPPKTETTAIPVAIPPKTETTATPTASAPTTAVAPASTMGVLSTEGTRPGHRIFVSGRVVGETPAVVKVKCGTHVVKVGSAGKPQTIDVPCGDRVVVKDH